MKPHKHVYMPCVKHPDCGLLRCLHCGKPKPPRRP